MTVERKRCNTPEEHALRKAAGTLFSHLSRKENAMKTTIAVLLTAVAITYTSSTASAAKLTASSSSNTSVTQLNYADLLYDYAVYAGEPRYHWFIIWEYGDGSTSEQGQFLTEQDALNFAA